MNAGAGAAAAPAAGAEAALVTLEGVSFSRGRQVIFDGIDLAIPRGRVTAIMGPSGTGKTTLLRLISGQLRPDRGRIVVDGQEVPRLRSDALYGLRKRIGMLFQSGALLSDMSVFDNVAFPLREHTRLNEALIRALVLMKLESVGLRGARDLMPAELSGGMARRVALARAIALDPMMVLYDEPFAGLDPISMGMVVQLIRLLTDALGLTGVVVSHDVKEVCSIADTVYVLSEGRIQQAGSPQELNESESPWVRQFMQGLPDGPVPFHYPAPPLAEDLLDAGGEEGWQR